MEAGCRVIVTERMTRRYIVKWRYDVMRVAPLWCAMKAVPCTAALYVLLMFWEHLWLGIVTYKWRIFIIDTVALQANALRLLQAFLWIRHSSGTVRVISHGHAWIVSTAIVLVGHVVVRQPVGITKTCLTVAVSLLAHRVSAVATVCRLAPEISGVCTVPYVYLTTSIPAVRTVSVLRPCVSSVRTVPCLAPVVCAVRAAVF